MKYLKVAFIVVGALTALVGGAETANWGLGSVAASLNTTAPRIMVSDTAPVDGLASGAGRAIDRSDAVQAPLASTPVAYRIPPSPPMEADPDGPRLDGDAHTDGAAPTDTRSGPSSGAGSEDAASGPPIAPSASLTHDDAESDKTASISPTGAGPD